jgi:hypothetical protein
MEQETPVPEPSHHYQASSPEVRRADQCFARFAAYIRERTATERCVLEEDLLNSGFMVTGCRQRTLVYYLAALTSTAGPFEITLVEGVRCVRRKGSAAGGGGQ